MESLEHLQRPDGGTAWASVPLRPPVLGRVGGPGLPQRSPSQPARNRTHGGRPRTRSPPLGKKKADPQSTFTCYQYLTNPEPEATKRFLSLFKGRQSEDWRNEVSAQCLACSLARSLRARAVNCGLILPASPRLPRRYLHHPGGRGP